MQLMTASIHSVKTFHEAWERLRDHELTLIFYDGLDLQDRYLLDATSGSTFMRKFEDEMI